MKNVYIVKTLLVLMVFQSSAFGQCQTELDNSARLSDINNVLSCLNAELHKVQGQMGDFKQALGAFGAKKLINPVVKIHKGNELQNSSTDEFRPIYGEPLKLQLPHSTNILVIFSAPDLWNEMAGKITELYIEMDNKIQIARGAFSSAIAGQRVPFSLSNVVLEVAAGNHEFNVLWKPSGGKSFLGANGTTVLALIPIQKQRLR